jgi:hypothetical protein
MGAPGRVQAFVAGDARVGLGLNMRANVMMKDLTLDARMTFSVMGRA